MRRMLSVLLTCCMLLGLLPTAAFATTTNSGNEFTLNMYRSGHSAATTYSAELVGASESFEGDLIASKTAIDVGSNKTSLTLGSIPNGTYTLTVTAQYHVPYSQELVFNNSNVMLNLCNNYAINDDNGKFGVMPVGDINGDGKIDDNDADIVLDDPAYDLTGDGKVDLQDLAIIIRNESDPIVAPTVPYTIPTAVAVDENTIKTEISSTGFTLSNKDDSAISEENPVTIELAPPPSSDNGVEGIVVAAPANSENGISQCSVTVTTEDDEELIYNLPEKVIQTKMIAPRKAVSAKVASPGEITKEADGTIVIDFGTRVAIKKVTIKVTGTESSGKLAEIAKVEFFQDFANRIPEPKLDIPTVSAVSNTESDGQGYKSLTVTWTTQHNITGYEVSVSGPGYSKTAVTSDTTYTFQGDSFNGTVKSFETYEVKVRSLNGDWKSGWSEVYSHTVTCTKAPPAPEYVSAVGGVKSLTVAWRCKFDAESFSLFYKKNGDSSFTEVKNITSSSYTLTELEGGVNYTVYVVAHNRNGSSPKSRDAVGMPMTPTGVELPKYKLMSNDVIQSISGNSNKSYTIYKADGSTVTNANATADDWAALLDGDPNTYLLIPDWDSGFDYSNFRGPIIQLDQKYTMDTIRMSPSEAASVHMNSVKIRYKDEDGALKDAIANFYTRYDAQNRRYYEAVLDAPITTDYLEVRTSTRYGASQNYTICEVRLYEYDDLEAKVKELFADSSHSMLKDTVTEETIQVLIDRVNTLDTESKEYHPHRETILNDLNYAMQLLKDGHPGDALTVDNQITATKAPASGFAQALSDYQPLGRVAEAGSSIIVYVSDLSGKATQGTNVNLQLVATQYHPEVAAWQASPIQLKAGRNEITVPKIGSYAKEAGGSLYLRYTGEKGASQYEVRVIGGTKIPVLNLDGITGEERTAAISTYVKALETYVAGLSSLHTSTHSDIGYDYIATECFLNATEITMENMMFSVPATQAWAAISGDPATKLSNAIAAMEQEIGYFYQFKGLNKSATDNDAYPNTRLNIRYHQMFTGAFMYAGGKHIGIEFGSVGGLFSTSPIVTDKNGKKTGGRYTGWGIAHEIGHCINAAAYQRVEVTNNLFAQLAQTDETNKTARPNYSNVYKAVVTGTTGHTGNLSTQLAMYWQLHLAYDNDYSYKVYNNIQSQQGALFYARLDSYLRTPSKAPVPMTATSGDQGLMQAACAAAGKNVLPFFRAWGIIPNQATETYASNFESETRKIQYIDDDSRLYRLEGNPGMSDGTTVSANITNATGSRINGNKVVISLSNSNTNQNAMLGYEIARNGKVVAFVSATEASYTDIVTTENNKSFVYTVQGIDRLLNETAVVTLDEVKVCHDGAIDKAAWTATTNMSSTADTVVDKDEDDPDSGITAGTEMESAIKAAIDNKTDTVYYGTKSGERPYVILNLGGVQQVTALKFTPDEGEHSNYRLFGYKIEISMDGTDWTIVKEGNCYTGTASNPDSWVRQEDIVYNEDGSYTMYFNKQIDENTMDPFMYTYDAAYVKLTATNMSAIGIAELDILGPTSDNVELVPEGYGKLKEDFIPEGESNAALSAGTIVFYGAYKGDPSYNIVVLKDQDGNIVDGEEIILAHVAEKGYLGETSDGRWIYGVQEADLEGVTQVIAELYRVQDATKLEGERLTSTSLHMTIPEDCPDVVLTGSTEELAAHVEDTSEFTANAEPETLSTEGEAQVSALFYGDTGSASEEIASRVKLTPNGNVMKFEAMRQDSSIAMQVNFTLSPAPANVNIKTSTGSDVYQTYRYDKDTGILNLYEVKRTGEFTSTLSEGSIENLGKGTVITATACDLFYAFSEIKEDEGPSAEGSIDADSGNKPVTPPSNPSSGSSGGSTKTFTLKFNTNGGSAISSVTKVSGTTLELNAYTPSKEGYVFEGWYTDSDLTKKVTSIKLTGDTTLYAKWVESVAFNFADVPKGAWYEDDVKFVYTNGIMRGTSATQFSPDMTTSRGMLVTMLYRMEGEPTTITQNPFSDVSSNSYYEDAVRWAFANHIVTGYTTTQFVPDDPITREQLATILHRYAKQKGKDVSASADISKYRDAATVHAYALPAMQWACATGLVRGTSDTTLSPTGNATRAQVAAIIHRF